MSQEEENKRWHDYYHNLHKQPEPQRKPKRPSLPPLDTSKPWYVLFVEEAERIPSGVPAVVYAGTPEALQREQEQEARRRLAAPFEFWDETSAFTSAELEALNAVARLSHRYCGGMLRPVLYQFWRILEDRKK